MVQAHFWRSNFHPVYFDLDGDTLYIPGDDRYGIIGGCMILKTFVIGRGVRDGEAELTMIHESLTYLAIGGQELRVSGLVWTKPLRT